MNFLKLYQLAHTWRLMLQKRVRLCSKYSVYNLQRDWYNRGTGNELQKSALVFWACKNYIFTNWKLAGQKFKRAKVLRFQSFLNISFILLYFISFLVYHAILHALTNLWWKFDKNQFYIKRAVATEKRDLTCLVILRSLTYLTLA